MATREKKKDQIGEEGRASLVPSGLKFGFVLVKCLRNYVTLFDPEVRLCTYISLIVFFSHFKKGILNLKNSFTEVA